MALAKSALIFALCRQHQKPKTIFFLPPRRNE
jgi:hypothetical protein